jgi:hypothetical protein
MDRVRFERPPSLYQELTDVFRHNSPTELRKQRAQITKWAKARPLTKAEVLEFYRQRRKWRLVRVPRAGGLMTPGGCLQIFLTQNLGEIHPLPYLPPWLRTKVELLASPLDKSENVHPTTPTHTPSSHSGVQHDAKDLEFSLFGRYRSAELRCFWKSVNIASIPRDFELCGNILPPPPNFKLCGKRRRSENFWNLSAKLTVFWRYFVQRRSEIFLNLSTKATRAIIVEQNAVNLSWFCPKKKP